MRHEKPNHRSLYKTWTGSKSRDAVRNIDLDVGLVGVLDQQRDRQAEEALPTADYEASDFVFTRPGGGAYHPQRVSRRLGTFTEELGLPRPIAHGLRHTSATLMLASGVVPKVAAERLGHADPTLFANHEWTAARLCTKARNCRDLRYRCP